MAASFLRTNLRWHSTSLCKDKNKREMLVNLTREDLLYNTFIIYDFIDGWILNTKQGNQLGHIQGTCSLHGRTSYNPMSNFELFIFTTRARGDNSINRNKSIKQINKEALHNQAGNTLQRGSAEEPIPEGDIIYQ